MITASLVRAPELSLRWIPVWRRNVLVWRKLAIAAVLGNIADPLLYMLPLGFLVGLTFGAFGLVMNSLAPGYDFFTYFFTLVLTPMLLLSGVFFPVEQMPAVLQTVAQVLPLTHAIDIARPLLAGRVPDAVPLHVAVLLAYAIGAYYIALVRTRRRLLK